MSKIPMYVFKLEDRTYRVFKKKWGMKDFDIGYAYVMSDINPYVYPYRGHVDNTEYATLPGLYSTKMNKKVIHFVRHPKTDADKKMYSKDRLIPVQPNIIFSELKDDIDDIPEIPIGEGDVFIPPIRQDDDIALIAMKKAIKEKQISVNSYSKRFKNTGEKNNSKRILTDGQTLTMSMADRFCDVFDLNMGIFIWDKKDAINPMNKDNVNRVYTIFSNSELDFKDPSIVFEQITREE